MKHAKKSVKTNKGKKYEKHFTLYPLTIGAAFTSIFTKAEERIMPKKQAKDYKAICDGVLKIGDMKISCVVLENGDRLLSQASFLRTIGRSRSPKKGTGITVDKTPTFLSADNLKPFIDNDLLESTKPINYIDINGKSAHGYLAEILPKVCEIYLKARDEKKLHPTQRHIAKKADILMRGFAHVGIIALIDEATGYQNIRSRKALEEILDKFIAKDLRKWAKTFPDEFYERMFELKGWKYNPFSVKRPGVVGKYTNDLVYDRLAPGVLEELKRITPRDKKGRRKHRYFQRLTEDIGHPALRERLASLIALERVASSWEHYVRMVKKAFPKFKDQIEIAETDED